MPEPGVVLVGLPGSGKSTVGRLLAARLGRPLVDTDELLEQRVGVAAPDYMRRHGEAAFRREEAAAVAEACRQHGAIIATGGGSVIDPLNRWALWHHGMVAWLDVPAETLASRLANDTVARPMFEPYSAERVAGFLAAREPMYRAADHRLDGSADAGSIAGNLVARLGSVPGRRLYDAVIPRRHPIGPESARVVLGVELAGDALPLEPVAIVDRRLVARAPELLRRIGARHQLAIAGGERSKRLDRLERILDWLVAAEVERGTPIAAVGGGTIGDLAGTAAALFARGLPLIQVPTTWLAQADSSIGGKVAVDLAGAKNMAGAFWPPVAVATDVAALRSLPVRLRRDGIAESVKAAMIGDPELWELLEGRGPAALRRDEAARYAIIERSVRLKLDVCDRDPFERGERRTLNLGHTVGHALEVADGYRLAHGAAVALGLRAVTAIAVARGGDPDLSARLDSLLGALGFALRHALDAGAVRAAMRSDKKRHAGRQRWILPMGIGRVTEVDDVSDAELARALRSIAA